MSGVAGAYLLDSHVLLQADGFEDLLISVIHGLWAGVCRQLHRDPFDRMLQPKSNLRIWC